MPKEFWSWVDDMAGSVEDPYAAPPNPVKEELIADPLDSEWLLDDEENKVKNPFPFNINNQSAYQDALYWIGLDFVQMVAPFRTWRIIQLLLAPGIIVYDEEEFVRLVAQATLP